jgi:hypothetical protein
MVEDDVEFMMGTSFLDDVVDEHLELPPSPVEVSDVL